MKNRQKQRRISRMKLKFEKKGGFPELKKEILISGFFRKEKLEIQRKKFGFKEERKNGRSSSSSHAEKKEQSFITEKKETEGKEREEKEEMRKESEELSGKKNGKKINLR